MSSQKPNAAQWSPFLSIGLTIGILAGGLMAGEAGASFGGKWTVITFYATGIILGAIAGAFFGFRWRS